MGCVITQGNTACRYFSIENKLNEPMHPNPILVNASGFSKIKPIQYNRESQSKIGLQDQLSIPIFLTFFPFILLSLQSTFPEITLVANWRVVVHDLNFTQNKLSVYYIVAIQSYQAIWQQWYRANTNFMHNDSEQTAITSTINHKGYRPTSIP